MTDTQKQVFLVVLISVFLAIVFVFFNADNKDEALRRQVSSLKDRVDMLEQYQTEPFQLSDTSDTDEN